MIFSLKELRQRKQEINKKHDNLIDAAIFGLPQMMNALGAGSITFVIQTKKELDVNTSLQVNPNNEKVKQKSGVNP